MTDREPFARDLRIAADESPAGSIAGLTDIADALRAQSATPARSTLARILGVSPLGARSRTAYRVAMGEVEIGHALDSIDGVHVLHSVRLDDGPELDHLVIGAAGVFLVMTLVHPEGIVDVAGRSFTVSEVRYPHIRTMEHSIGRVERLLSTAAGVPVEVSGILAVVDPKSLAVRQAHRDVAVIPAPTIVRWLSRRPAVLEPAEVEHIAGVADRASTWRSDMPATDDAAELRHDFELLRVEVTRAWRLQRLWATAATVIAASGLIVVICSIVVSAIGS